MNDDVVTSIETSAMTLAWIPDIIAGLVLVLQAPLGPCARVFDPSPKSLKWTALPTSRGRVGLPRLRRVLPRLRGGESASPGFAGYSPDFAGPPSPGFAGYSPDFAGPPSPGFAGYSPDFAGERALLGRIGYHGNHASDRSRSAELNDWVRSRSEERRV